MSPSANRLTGVTGPYFPLVSEYHVPKILPQAHVERFDQAYANDRASRTFSVNELKDGGPSEATRLANFEADQPQTKGPR